MFREMRRKKQRLSEEACAAMLTNATSGVLAVSGDGGYPYAVPMSFVFRGGKIYFHCAGSGHKLDAIARDDKASFCVIAEDRIVEEAYTTYFRSVIAFGRARVVEDADEKRLALEALAEKYSPRHEAGRLREIERLFSQVCVVALTVEHLTGKAAIELVRAAGENPVPPTWPNH
ncbi:pyridoxamine 5'-phosphate oxidase family protein [Oscillospiraceae bacterium OttesenSCG-928-F05]|nr:pyridoxamine 5'-phosphate oxidase family protein [Oscillospiraceae bacterium OttesenSCG-928-F05]